MSDEHDATTREAIALELAAAVEETARLRRALAVIEADLARVVELFAEAIGRGDFGLDLLHELGDRRPTLH